MSILFIIILILSVVIHESAHGYAADYMGDPTPRMYGRLTLNPLPHIDPIGSVVLPLLLLVTGAPFLIGWAKPVPFNPRNFATKYRRWGNALVAAAGPASNIIIALIFSLILNVAPLAGGIVILFQSIILINLVLAFFNLIPVPPLDGHHILLAFLPNSPRVLAFKKAFMQMSWIGMLVAFFVVWQFIQPLIWALYNILI